jgi:glycine cleavage system regulatory protein
MNSLNSDGHQFNKYQQKEQLPLILTKLTEHLKRPRHMTLEIQVLALDRHKNVAELKRLMGSKSFRLDNSNIYI